LAGPGSGGPDLPGYARRGLDVGGQGRIVPDIKGQAPLPAMRLPASALAIVGSAKIRDYLLAHDHPVGRFKAAFFEALGYTRNDWQRLQQDLLALASSAEAVPGQPSAFGPKYEVRGTIQTPSGRQAEIVTVWIILAGESAPRFVTAFPGEPR
jgi:hypothetical protein